jgi:hypothetical protein
MRLFIVLFALFASASPVAAQPEIHLVLAFSERCIDIAFASHDNGAKAIQFECHNQNNQIWQMQRTNEVADEYYIRNKNSGKCLEVSEGSQNAGAVLQQWECNQGNHQKFRFSLANSRYSGWARNVVVLRHSSMCVTVEGGTIRDDARIIQFGCSNEMNQKILWVDR